MKTKEILQEYRLELVAFIVVAGGFYKFHNFFGELANKILIFAFAFLLGLLIRVLRIRREVLLLLEQHGETNESLRKPLALFFRNQLLKLGALRRQLTGSEGHEFDLEEMEKFVAACFKANGSRKYVGTDSNVPSLFRKLYPNYLDEHFNKASSPGQDIRILFACESELRADYAGNKSEFELFMQRHERHFVLLLQVEKAVAKKAAEEQRFPATDIGIFGTDFVVFYKPRADHGASSGCKVLMEPLDEERKKQLREYLRRLNTSAKEIKLVGDVLKCEERGKGNRELDEERLFGHLQS